ncbi:glycosyl transferase [Shewanella sp. TC10]|uniref:glycosyl transferase n=1 Tax=Shewanella sp. TC10 TaxID=1419739 RepID=UPI001892C5BF|nr:glycosyl transferase [Shewanella sp. TC10]
MVEQHTAAMLDADDFDNRKLVKTLGKGIKGSRSLNFAEASHLITAFAKGDLSSNQMAAAMMLMRVRGESIEELAGVAAGLKQLVPAEWQSIKADIDWPVYAGKREQLPWLLLAAKILAKNGQTIILHGDSQSLPHRRHVEAYISALDIPRCFTAEQAKVNLASTGIIYVNSADIVPVLNDCRRLHQELGLRSLIQMSVRCINPTNASNSLRSYFHPGLDKQHQQVALLMAQKQAGETSTTPASIAIFKGLQGETEINPRVATQVSMLRFSAIGNQMFPEQTQIEIPTQLEAFVGAKVGHSDLPAHLLAQLWHGEDIEQTELTDLQLQQAIGSVTATLALVYALLSPSLPIEKSIKRASKNWFLRNNSASLKKSLNKTEDTFWLSSKVDTHFCELRV